LHSPLNKMSEAIRDLFEELNQPSAARLKAVLKRRGIEYDAADVDALVRKSGQRQIFAPRQQYPGKVTAPARNTRWAADSIHLASNPSKPGGEKYILVAQDIFSRRLFAEALQTISGPAVTRAFERFTALEGIPLELSTDEGSEFTNPTFRAALAQLGVAHRVKAPQNKNAIATLDNAIGRLKQALFRQTAGQGTLDWASLLPKVVSGMNQSPHEHLMESAPDDVPPDEILTFALMKQASHDMQKNQEVNEKRVAELRGSGAFRVELPANLYTRGFKPRYSDAVHPIGIADGRVQVSDAGRVTDDKGKSFAAKFIRGVPLDSTGVFSTTTQGSAQTEARQRREMEPFATRVAAQVGRGRTMSLNKVSKLLAGAGFAAASKRAGIHQKHPIANFLRVFPERFVVNAPRVGGAASVTVR